MASSINSTTGAAAAAAAAERARRIAEEQRREAERAQKAAREAQQARQRAQQQAQQAAQRANRVEREAGNNVNKVERKAIERTQDKVTRAEDRLADAREAERAAEDRALTQGNQAIRAQQDANEAAVDAGKDKPFETAEGLRDTYDAGSLSAKDQKKLFGTRAAVTPKEAAESDAQAVAEAAALGPKEGAKELQRQLESSDDPAFRSELFELARPSLDTISQGAFADGVPQEELDATVRSLSKVADLAGSEDARFTVSDSLTRASKGEAGAFLSGTPEDLSPPTGGPERLEAALGANVKDPAGARLALEVSDRLNEAGDYDAADRIENLDPKLKERAEQTRGETAARDSVQVHTAADLKGEVEDQQRALGADARESVDKAFELAGDPDKLPPNTEVVSEDENRVVLEERNKDGEVVARTTAVREGEEVRFEQLEYGKKDAVRTRLESGPEGTYSLTASWKEGASKNPGQPPSVEALRQSREEGVTLQEERIYTNDDGNLVHDAYSQGNQGIEKTTRTFSQQTGEDGIDDNFDDKFDYGQPIDKVTTRTVSIPAAGVEGPDGAQKNPSVVTSTAYAQDGVQATSTNARPLEDRAAIDTDQCYQRPVYDDIARVEAAAEDLDDDKVPPKQWNLEVSNGNTYEAQTFVEGQEDLSTITTRTARGNTVTETITGKAPNEDGEAVEVSSESTRTFRDDGSLASLHSESEGPDGTVTVQDYESQRRRTAKGFRLDDHLTVTETDPDGNISVSDKRTSSLITGDGPQLLSSEQTLTDSDGNVARKRWDERGESFAVAGPGESLRAVPEDELENLEINQQQLLATADATVLQDVKDYASAGEKAVKALGNVPAAQSTLTRLNQNPQAALEARYGTVTASTATNLLRGTASAAGAVAGAAEVAVSAQGLFNGFRDGTVGAIVTNGAGLATGTKNVVDGGKGLIAAVRGAPLAASATASTSASWLTRVGGKFGVIGIGAGLVGGGLQIKEGIESGRESLIAQGGVTVVAAVAAPVAATVVGGAVAGATAGSVAPVVGTLVGAAAGALVGLAAWGVNKAIGAIFDDEHAIAEVQI